MLCSVLLTSCGKEVRTETGPALREIYEEVGLKVKLQKNFRTTEEYTLSEKNNAPKQVVYFCGEYAVREIIPQASECSRAELVPYEKALQ